MSEAFHDFEYAGWSDESVCGSYDGHFSSLTTQSVDALLDAARVVRRSRLLDVATGAGYAAGAALERGAQVTGVDFSPAQVSLAKQRYPAAAFRQCDACDLPFEGDSFDAVVCNYGVLHFYDQPAFFREAFRVLGSGGRLAFTVWDVPRETRLFGAILEAIERYGSLDVGLPAGPNMFALSDPAACERTVAEAGFTGCAVAKLHQAWRVASPEVILDSIRTGTVRTRAALVRQRPDARKAIDAAIIKTLESFRTEAGYEIPMPAILAGATKP